MANVTKESRSVLPTTTEQEDISHAGQRRINLIWEITQAFIALSITWAIIFMQIKGIRSDGTLTNAFFLITAMYFVRTNHKQIGGVGPKTANESR